ncbi:Signal transduction histidine kinase [Austwickia chelonae]|uniref:histidine kinase n=1 Tax=Austwickia chelonae NBRC 105200 TaxID=1184607 RepID=K6VU05_9MICO|nr:histidine kinase [Austwickia chelonae]GAB78825.1 putative two-component histidine kinase [Austwickia chelonae NBRC 105200]SEV84887.1 Signal transduction histidine kinase [Austwickia chelonae]
MHHPRRVDAIWAGLNLFGLATVVGREASMGNTPAAVGLMTAFALVTSAVLLFRSRAPLLVFATTTVAQVLGGIGGVGGPSQLPACIALYSVVASLPLSAAAASVAASMTASAAELMWRPLNSQFPLINYLLSGWFWIMASVVLAVAVRAKREGLARKDAALRAAMLKLQEQTEQRYLRERMVLANDLHDSVGHSLTAVIALAGGGARSLPDHPEEAAEALEFIERTARGCLTRTRDVVDRLHRPERPGETRSVTDIDQLVETARAAGLSVDYRRFGVEPDSHEIGDICFHLVQEGLTNVLRHARGAEYVSVHIVHGDQQSSVSVCDDGESSARANSSQQHGLSGLNQRVTQLGGSFQAGPHQPRGWQLRATLPWSETS